MNRFNRVDDEFVSVFDTSPLIFLDLLEYREAVSLQYHPVVPPQVAAELSVKSDRPGSELVEAGLVEVVKPTVERIDQVRLELNVGIGEVAALALAFDLRVPVILDDAVPRRYARAAGLEVSGTLGVLLHLHRSGMGLRSPEADVAALAGGGMWLSEEFKEVFVERVRNSDQRQL